MKNTENNKKIKTYIFPDTENNKETLEQDRASQNKQLIEAVENDEYFKICQGCSCDAKERFIKTIKELDIKSNK